MKNLYKKIGVVALSGLVLIGGGALGGKSVAHAALPGQLINEKPVNQLLKSKYEEIRWKLRLQKASEEDIRKVEKGGYSGLNYRILNVDPYPERLNSLVEIKPHLADPAKYFVDVDSFINYMMNEGKELKGFYNMCIKGGIYIIEFGVKR